MLKKFPNKLKLSDKSIQNLMKRFSLPNVDENVIDKKTVCLEWIGRYDDYNRPIFSIKGQYRLAKHVVYESWYEKIETGMTIINTCRNDKCVRPDHLKMSFYFYRTVCARNGKKDPKDRRKKLKVNVNEKRMLNVFNKIKYGQLKSISDIGRFLNVDDCYAVEFLNNNNWMYLNNIYKKDQLDELRAKVMPKEKTDMDKHLTIRKVCNDFFKTRGCCST